MPPSQQSSSLAVIEQAPSIILVQPTILDLDPGIGRFHQILGPDLVKRLALQFFIDLCLPLFLPPVPDQLLHRLPDVQVITRDEERFVTPLESLLLGGDPEEASPSGSFRLCPAPKVSMV